MWHKLQNITAQPGTQRLLKLLGDPVQLYAVFLVMTVMYYYHASMVWLYTLLAVPISWCMMRLYDFIARHKYIGILTYLVYLFAGLEIVSIITNYGKKSYPIHFMVWFLTPQSVVSYSFWYTIAIYLLMLGFLTSAVYYFARIRYRMSMQFLIMLIPMSFYAKEGQHMPALLSMLLLAGYFLLMIYCRQIQDSAQVRTLTGFHANVSVAMYVMGFSVLACIVPKPVITPDREFIDNAMSYSSWSDILMNAISMFTDSTDNSVASSGNGRTIYYVNAPESLRLRTQTYSWYDGTKDSWNVQSAYDKPSGTLQEPLTYRPQDVLQAILDAAARDATFAAQCHLTEMTDVTLPEQELRSIYLYTRYPSQVLPSPTRTYQLGAEVNKQDVLQSAAGTVSASSFSNGVSCYYYADSYARYEAVKPLLLCLSGQDYGLVLDRAMQILEHTPQQSLLMQAKEEYEQAYAYYNQVQESDFHSATLDQLAAEITAGCHSDFEKALAIEQYFTRQGFVYDLSYQKAKGENVTDFLTRSKTGVCYEFATAMVLLCRSAGIPARYAQGYNLSELYRSKIFQHETNYIIKVRDAHAFPEVYISGFGWMSFEPTVAAMESMESTGLESQLLMRWGFVLLLVAVLACILYMRLHTIQEFFFRKKLLHMTPQQSASALFRHMRRQLRLPESTTVDELAYHSRFFCPESMLYPALNVLLYSHTPHHDCHPELLHAADRQDGHDACSDGRDAGTAQKQNPDNNWETTEGKTTRELTQAYVQWQALRVQYEKAQAGQRKSKAVEAGTSAK